MKQDEALRISLDTHSKFKEAQLLYTRKNEKKVKLKDIADLAITAYIETLKDK